MSSPRQPDDASLPIGGRYAVEQEIGRGGMGVVYRVRDLSRGGSLALKRLHADVARTRPQILTLFEREYHTLVELQHPRIIEVYDYGVDSGGPYYTMELLEGGDLASAAPVPWRRACGLLWDVASSLAVLHARRLLHRDLSARNVRITGDGRAKLIDFGAMTEMGIAEDIVGSPAVVPPEALSLAPLDERADLFGLGTLAYFLLTGQQAYPAPRLAALRAVWARGAQPLSELAVEVPEGLERLVSTLIRLNPSARPVSAAEVMERLAAIGGIGPETPRDLKRAYLTTPALVGRERVLGRFRGLLGNLREGRGGCWLVHSAPGMGRTRLLEALGVAARLSGATVLAAQASTGGRTLQVVDDLLQELLAAAPELSPHFLSPPMLPALAVLPELAKRLGHEPSTSPAPADSMESLREGLHEAIEGRTLVVLVDDAQGIDVHAATLLSELAQRAAGSALAVVASCTTETLDSPSMRPFRRSCEHLELGPLENEAVATLVHSLFGDVPRLGVVTEWIVRHSEGHPRTCMELAEHVVEKGIARYERGAWYFPEGLSLTELPESLDQALKDRLGSLGPDARELAEIIAVASPERLRVRECARALESWASDRLDAVLEELVRARVVVAGAEPCQLAQAQLVPLLRSAVDGERQRLLHRRVADLLQAREPPDPAAALHWMDGGRPLEAVACLFDRVRGESSSFDSPIPGNPERVRCFYERALAFCRDSGRSTVEQLELMRMLVELGYASEPDAVAGYHESYLRQLRCDAGLDLWEASDPRQDPLDRIIAAQEAAAARRAALPENQRGYSPEAAYEKIRRYSMVMQMVYGRMWDADGLARLPALLEPFRALTEDAQLEFEGALNTADQIRGQWIADRRRRTALLAKRDTVPLHYYCGLDEAHCGREAALEEAEILEQDAVHAALGWEVRLVASIFLGDHAEASRSREQRDRLAARADFTHAHLVKGALYEAEGLGLAGDLLGLKRAIERIDAEAERYAGWRLERHAFDGIWHMLHGEHGLAIDSFHRVFETARPGRHIAWARSAVPYVESLIAVGSLRLARTWATRALSDAEAQRLRPVYCTRLQAALALVMAHSGELPIAEKLAVRALDTARALRIGGVPRGRLSEMRAEVAILAGDRGAFEEARERLERIYLDGGQGSLCTRYELLVDKARRADLLAAEPGRTRGPAALDEGVRALLSELRAIGDTRQRVCAVLRAVVERTRANAGHLFALTEGDGLELAASHEEESPAGLEDAIGELIERQGEGETQSATADTGRGDEPLSEVWSSADGVAYSILLCSSLGDETWTVSAAVALRGEDLNLSGLPSAASAALGALLVDAGVSVSRQFQV